MLIIIIIICVVSSVAFGLVLHSMLAQHCIVSKTVRQTGKQPQALASHCWPVLYAFLLFIYDAPVAGKANKKPAPRPDPDLQPKPQSQFQPETEPNPRPDLGDASRLFVR